MERPDLSTAAPEIVEYIEALESKLKTARETRSSRNSRSDAPQEPSEPPTSMNVISVSTRGLAKRTPRHLYFRQRRGGMGIFELDSPEGDPPAFLTIADEKDSLIFVTSRARAFRLPVEEIAEAAIRGRGEAIGTRFPMAADEKLSLIFPDKGGSYIALVSQRGQVRRISSHYFGPKLQAGTVLYDIQEGGPPAAVCWTPGDADLVLVTRLGKGIRFGEKQVPVRGCLGMRVDRGDEIVGITAAKPSGGVFIANSEGKGTIRLLSGFTANKAPGAGGKVAMKSDSVIGMTAIDDPTDTNFDIFLISQLGKVIRFPAAEVPAKTGVVQGVNCMNLRSDACIALASSVVVEGV